MIGTALLLPVGLCEVLEPVIHEPLKDRAASLKGKVETTGIDHVEMRL